MAMQFHNALIATIAQEQKTEKYLELRFLALQFLALYFLAVQLITLLYPKSG